MKQSVATVLVILFSLVLLISIPVQLGLWNGFNFMTQKIDDATNYETIKDVENQCRAMIASYEADKQTYLIYMESEDKEELSWAQQAKIRANRTASNYNNYILKNSFVWAGNVPSDIRMNLEVLD